MRRIQPAPTALTILGLIFLASLLLAVLAVILKWWVVAAVFGVATYISWLLTWRLTFGQPEDD